MKPVRLLTLVFACVVAANICSAQEVTFMADGREHVERIEEQYSVEPGGTLTIDADFGGISIETWDENEVDVLVEKRIRDNDEARARRELEDVEVEVSQHGHDVRIEVDKSGWFKRNKVRVKMTVCVPGSYNLDMKTAGGDIEVADLKGNVKAGTAGGDIDIGTVDTKTTGGNIGIGTVWGNVTAKTTGGNVEIGPTSGNVDAKTVGGNIEIDDVRGTVNTNALGGRVTVGSP